MEKRAAEKLANSYGCEFYFDRQKKKWAIHPSGARMVEARGGRYVDGRDVRNATREEFFIKFVKPIVEARCSELQGLF